MNEKIDVLEQRIASLGEVCKERWDGHRREHELIAEQVQSSLLAIERRLNMMNDLREQILEERGDFLKSEFREYYEAHYNDLNHQIDILRDQLNQHVPKSEYSTLVTEVSALRDKSQNLAGRFWALGTAIAIVLTVINMGIAGFQALRHNDTSIPVVQTQTDQKQLQYGIPFVPLKPR